jgi:hypothetical protein
VAGTVSRVSRITEDSFAQRFMHAVLQLYKATAYVPEGTEKSKAGAVRSLPLHEASKHSRGTVKAMGVGNTLTTTTLHTSAN